MIVKNKTQSGLSKSSKVRHLVALDIGTEFVKALVARVKDNQLEIVGVGRARQGLSDMQSGAISDIAAVVENCDAALTQAEQQAGVDARDVVIGIAGELVQGKTATIKLRRANSQTPITEAEMMRIVEKVQQRAEANAARQLAFELGSQDAEVRLVNSAIVSMHIDGYKVTNPIGFQGKDIRIQLYTAFAPMIHIGALERVAEELDLDLLAVAAEPFAVARAVIGDDGNSTISAICIDIGGGTTDIAVVNDGGVEGTKMFGIGGRSFTRTISNEAGVDFDMAEEMKLRIAKKDMSDAQQKTAETAVNKTLDVWLNGVELALEDFAQLDHLPNRILLCGGGSSLVSLGKKLQSGDWYHNLAFTRKPRIEHISPSQVVGIIDKTDSIHDHTYITASGLLRVGLDTVYVDDDRPNTVKDKLNRLLSI